MATVKYFGPGRQSVALGSESDKWAKVNAIDAGIDSFKNKGNTSTPVYFDENGIPQAVTSINEAAHAESADSATNAVNATNAGHAESADSATNAVSADKLTTARTITLAGGATGSATFDGSSDVTINVAVSGGASGGTDDFFTVNDDWFLVPSENPTVSNSFQLNSDGFITIKET